MPLRVVDDLRCPRGTPAAAHCPPQLSLGTDAKKTLVNTREARPRRVLVHARRTHSQHVWSLVEKGPCDRGNLFHYRFRNRCSHHFSAKCLERFGTRRILQSATIDQPLCFHKQAASLQKQAQCLARNHGPRRYRQPHLHRSGKIRSLCSHLTRIQRLLQIKYEDSCSFFPHSDGSPRRTIAVSVPRRL